MSGRIGDQGLVTVPALRSIVIDWVLEVISKLSGELAGSYFLLRSLYPSSFNISSLVLLPPLAFGVSTTETVIVYLPGINPFPSRPVASKVLSSALYFAVEERTPLSAGVNPTVTNCSEVAVALGGKITFPFTTTPFFPQPVSPRTQTVARRRNEPRLTIRCMI